MNQKRKEYLQKVKSKGIFRFILINGILLWGLPVGLFTMFFYRFYDYYFDYAYFQKSKNLSLTDIIVELLIWAIVGCFIGWFSWNRLQKEISQEDFENK